MSVKQYFDFLPYCGIEVFQYDIRDQRTGNIK